MFQILGIQDQNTINLNGLEISRENFNQFLKRHKYLNPVAEDNESMIESYVMINPLGRFYQNSGYTYTFSRPILEEAIVNEILGTFEHNKQPKIEIQQQEEPRPNLMDIDMLIAIGSKGDPIQKLIHYYLIKKTKGELNELTSEIEQIFTMAMQINRLLKLKKKLNKLREKG